MKYFSVAGKHHGYDAANNQDAVLCREDGRFCAMVLADGVSSCEHAGTGAVIACETTLDFLLRHSERLFHMQASETAESLLAQVRCRLERAAGEQHSTAEAYASTLACVLYDRQLHKLLYCSIGDSLIVATREEACYIMAMPADSRNGCCVTTTSHAASMAKAGILDADGIASVMICSDGAWHLMYRRNRMYPLIRDTILRQDYEKLEEMLLEQERWDDCSFTSMDLDAFPERKPA